MDVIDGLSTVFPGVNHCPISLRQPFAPRYFRTCPEQMTQKRVMLFACVRDGANMLKRNYENMYRRLGI